ncbi:hypothetical protein ODZ84_09735 [Chryseobacterium fluminis]|uniref:hypothetical protein n=1 Tax=Chryseobacterium fluminis TaxID=2983606 RepID=UPI002257C2F4|nr:hypothetical protein [Chryseobacterium sp. MMS21-Ot14]UZT99818.1 hypothetical protein ODZ84_09735 [Chryseobacterium sp. MMS21-Ot14]
MEIEFLLSEKTLLITSYIKLIGKKDFDKVIIKKNDIKSINMQFGEISNQNLVIRVSFKTFKNDYIFNTSDILVKNREIILMGILNNPLGLYNQGYIDNFKLLSDKREKIRWYELTNKEKYYYLRGCCLLSGVRENIDNTSSIIVIDLSKVATDLDVYYEIGKAFFNSYGYFGTEFHSFRDCLVSIGESMKKREKIPSLKIKGYRNFKKYFSKNILFSDFYEQFTSVGFEIIN